MTIVERQLRLQAVQDFTYPNCGQPPGQRCRKPTRDWRDRFTIYNYVGPHRERVELAYREALAEECRP